MGPVILSDASGCLEIAFIAFPPTNPPLAWHDIPEMAQLWALLRHLQRLLPAAHARHDDGGGAGAPQGACPRLRGAAGERRSATDGSVAFWTANRGA